MSLYLVYNPKLAYINIYYQYYPSDYHVSCNIQISGRYFHICSLDFHMYFLYFLYFIKDLPIYPLMVLSWGRTFMDANA